MAAPLKSRRAAFSDVGARANASKVAIIIAVGYVLSTPRGEPSSPFLSGLSVKRAGDKIAAFAAPASVKGALLPSIRKVAAAASAYAAVFAVIMVPSIKPS